MKQFAVALLFLGLVPTTAFAQCAPDNGGISLPPGFCASVFADDLGTARHLVVNGKGDVYVALAAPRHGGGIVGLRDTDGDGRADVVKYFGEVGGTGIGIHDGYLYFASPTEVLRYKLNPGKLLPQMPAQVVVSGFPVQHEHAAKSITFDQSGHLYVNVGAPSNACQRDDRTEGSPGIRPCPLLAHHGGIWQFDADRIGQDFVRDGKRYATGLRNAVAITWHGGLFAVQMGRDQLHENWPKLFDAEQGNELPAEEFLHVTPQADFGWPYCYYDGLRARRVLAPEYGGDGNKTGDCAQYPAPLWAFPAHWAPEAIVFLTSPTLPAAWRDGFLISFHGSWNRSPRQAGFKLMFVPFHERRLAGSPRVFADGFAGTGLPASPGAARFRPMGLAIAPEGTLYIGDTQQGRVWRVVYTGVHAAH